MSPLSIVVISVLAALFALLLLAAIGALIYAHILVRREIASFSLTVRDSGVKLESQCIRIEGLIGSVHGDKIEKAAKEIIAVIPQLAKVATRNEKVALLIIDTLNHIRQEEGISGGDLERARASGLGPEDYATASPGERYVSRSRTAESDAEALAIESESATADSSTSTSSASSAIAGFDSQSFGDET